MTMSHPTPFSSLFFQSSGSHRALHSFPTRRSSDLGSGWPGTTPYDAIDELYTICFIPAFAAAAKAGMKQIVRSEEHTSELQSHHDLVCRLLLEKKKKKQQKHT